MLVALTPPRISHSVSTTQGMRICCGLIVISPTSLKNWQRGIRQALSVPWQFQPRLVCAIGAEQSYQNIKSGLVFRFFELLSWLSLSLMARALNPSEARSHQWQEMSASTDSLQTPSKELSITLEISGAGLTNRKFMPCPVQGLPKGKISEKLRSMIFFSGSIARGFLRAAASTL